MEWKHSYIYKVTNLINGKLYIGQSVSPIERLMEHINIRSKYGYLLNCAVKKYGIENFMFEIIRSEIPLDKIDETEIECIKEYESKVPNGYNLTDGGEGLKGHKHSEETKRKISLAQTGRKHSEETRNKHRSLKHTDETKKKIRSYKHSEETRKKMSLSARNRLVIKN